MDKILNENGEVAVVHWNSNGAAVGPLDGIIYQFVPRNTVSLAWIKEEHLDYVLSLRAKICCNKTRLKFSLANKNQLSVYNTGRLP